MGHLARAAGEWVAKAPAIPAALLLSGLAFVFVPAQLYAGNEADFFYRFAQGVLPLLPLFAAAFALLAAPSAFGPAAWRRGYAAALGGVAIAAWVNASFLLESGLALDGKTLLALGETAKSLRNAAAVAAIAIAGGLAAWRFVVPVRTFLALLALLLGVQAGWVAASGTAPWRGEAARALASFSPEKNVLVILLDTFQADFFAEVLDRDPQLREALDGFTWFPDAIAGSPTTYLSLPAIHSGRPYREGERLRETFRRDIVDGSFLTKLARQGYDALLVNPVLNACPADTACETVDRLVYGATYDQLKQAAYLLDLSLFRLAPEALRPALYRGGSWWLFAKFGSPAATPDNEALALVARQLRTDAARPVVRFIHLFNTHPPVRVDANCTPLANGVWDRAGAIGQDGCAMRHVAAVLAAMRAAGAYDRTLVAILADHGAGMPVDTGVDWSWGAAASPLLMVKPFAARGAFAVSRRVVGLSDLSATVCALTGACPEEGGRNLMNDAPRSPAYPFAAYAWKHEYWFTESVPLLDTFVIRGPPREIGSWVRQSHLPAAAAADIAFAKSDAPATWGFGWSGFETHDGRDWRWALGSEADLYLKLDAGRDARMSLDVSTHGLNPDQALTVLANGLEVARVQVPARDSHFEFTVPAAAIGVGSVRLLFRFAQAHPVSAADPRPLAVLFDRLAIRQ